MYIHHIAIWTADLERLLGFYSRFFHCHVSKRYNNPKKQFSSYFLSFPKGPSIEIMQQADITEPLNHERIGLAHFSISVGSKEQVDAFTKMLEDEGVRIHNYPRTTGDGYYESVILDPDGNKIELTTGS